MSISDLENKIFHDWRRTRQGFVADGVADEREYLSSREKILFVLKEVNDQGGGGWDLREFMREGARPRTWDVITRWVRGVRALPEEIPWNQLSEVSEQDRIAVLKSIAAMNLKKSPGGHTTDRAELDRAAEMDKESLNQQFALYDADLVICCSPAVTDNLHRQIDTLASARWKVTTRGIEYHEYRPAKFVIAFAHPEARVDKCLLHYGLMDAVSEIRSNS